MSPRGIEIERKFRLRAAPDAQLLAAHGAVAKRIEQVYLRLGAATAVVGAIVAEVSTGTKGGIGRLIIAYAQSASGDPAKPWAAIVGAALLGLVAAGLVSLLSLGLGRFRHSEVS